MIDTYYTNVLFSYLHGTNTLKSEYKSVKNYELETHSQVYSSDGKMKENTSGLMFDQKI